eukprot:CAMPEP_0175174950 /NCGR_PEP_ID=MMETSP0087-20121206/32930_1 /TAXON_ID=136419 /ORGANISM="Unknown Unknown, Strain D1" /LENGTH=183 /DNA_ID=CAMNT_0016466503 /DNA_START=28 /DNA_END=576 /DNA_ORIENTATION=+
MLEKEEAKELNSMAEITVIPNVQTSRFVTTKHGATQIPKNTATKIAFDFGGTIGDWQQDAAFERAFEILKIIICRYGAKNVFIISKAREQTALKTIDFLKRKEFGTITGFLWKNCFFVPEYTDKRILVDYFGIHIFVDDEIKIVRSLVAAPSIQKIVWFQGQEHLLKDIPKQHRNKVVINPRW